jgi:hypothetical protein
VTQQEFERFMASVVPYPSPIPGDIVMGGFRGLELHGGGVLGLLANIWRPESRRPTLADRYPFSNAAAPIALQDIYRAHERQLFLPVPGLAPEEIDSVLPEAPGLPRMRFARGPTGLPGTTEVDAYTFLELLLRFEGDLSRTFTNHLNQHLSADLVLGQTWAHYLAPRSAEAEFADHSYLHLPEILLSYAHRDSTRDPDEIKRHFLAVELSRTDYGGYDASEALGHYTDTLGLMLDDPRLRWADTEKQQIRLWLTDLERRLPERLEEIPLQHLAHLARGLRSVQRNADRLLPTTGWFPWH